MALIARLQCRAYSPKRQRGDGVCGGIVPALTLGAMVSAHFADFEQVREGEEPLLQTGGPPNMSSSKRTFTGWPVDGEGTGRFPNLRIHSRLAPAAVGWYFSASA